MVAFAVVQVPRRSYAASTCGAVFRSSHELMMDLAAYHRQPTRARWEAAVSAWVKQSEQTEELADAQGNLRLVVGECDRATGLLWIASSAAFDALSISNGTMAADSYTVQTTLEMLANSEPAVNTTDGFDSELYRWLLARMLEVARVNHLSLTRLEPAQAQMILRWIPGAAHQLSAPNQ